MAFFHSFAISSSLPQLLFLVFLCLCLQCTWWRTGEETTRRTHAWPPAGQLCVAAVFGTCWHNEFHPSLHSYCPIAPSYLCLNPQRPPSLPALKLPALPSKPILSLPLIVLCLSINTGISSIVYGHVDVLPSALTAGHSGATLSHLCRAAKDRLTLI